MHAALHATSLMAFARHIRVAAADEKVKVRPQVRLLRMFDIFWSLLIFHETAFVDA